MSNNLEALIKEAASVVVDRSSEGKYQVTIGFAAPSPARDLYIAIEDLRDEEQS